MNELDLCCIFAAMKATGIMNAIINKGSSSWKSAYVPFSNIFLRNLDI